MGIDSEITDPMTIIEQVAEIKTGNNPIDLPITEFVRHVLSRFRISAKSRSPAVQRVLAAVAARSRKELDLMLELSDEAKKFRCSCGKLLSPQTFRPKQVQKRNGRAPRCRECACRAVLSARTSEERRALAKKGALKIPYKKRVEQAKKASAALTCEARSVAAKKREVARRAAKETT